LSVRDRSLAGEEWTFRPAPKISELGHRTVPSRETLARARAQARRIPISRLADLTPLDRLRLPVYSATTPLARDLTIHTGKGLDPESAELSAIMEAIERVSAEQVERPTLRSSFRRISDKVRSAIDPRAFDLPDDSRFADDRPFTWIDGWDLVRKETVWLPLDLATSPPAEGILRHVDTNGLAAGNTLLEAIVHALCEVIERDVLGLLLFRSIFGDADDEPVEARSIAPESLPEVCREWRARISGNGLVLETEALESDTRIPVFRSVLIDDAYPSSRDTETRLFVGFGASPNATVAVIRSITEAVQSRVGIVHGARDSFNSVSAPWRRWGPRVTQGTDARRALPLSDVLTFSTTDLLEDLHYLLQRLTEAGFDRVIAVNLSRRDFELPVVRVRVPGLTSFAVNRRRIGWRCLRYLL
jgi:YcaO-like protein with predicted kinase domain